MELFNYSSSGWATLQEIVLVGSRLSSFTRPGFDNQFSNLNITSINARPTSAVVQISRRSHQESGIGGVDVESRTTRDVSGPSLQKSVGYHLQSAGQSSRSEEGLLKDSNIGENSKKAGAPRSWANFTMDGMIADILSKREQ